MPLELATFFNPLLILLLRVPREVSPIEFLDLWSNMGHIFLWCLRWLRNLVEIDARYLARRYSFPPRLTIFSRRGSRDDRLSGTKMRAGNRAVTALTGRRKTYCNDLRVGSGTSTSRGTCVLAWTSRASACLFYVPNQKNFRYGEPGTRPCSALSSIQG